MPLPEGGEMGYLVPIDGNQNNLLASAIPMDDLKRFQKEISRIEPAWLKISDWNAGNIPPITKLNLRLVCSRGTYVRSIAHDLGNLLGCGAYVSKLQRTRVGSLDMTMARSLDEIDRAVAMGELEACFVPPHLALSSLDHVSLQHSQLDSFSHGNAVPLPGPGREIAEVCAVFDDKRDLFGIGEWRGGGRFLQPVRVLREPAYAN